MLGTIKVDWHDLDLIYRGRQQEVTGNRTYLATGSTWQRDVRYLATGRTVLGNRTFQPWQRDIVWQQDVQYLTTGPHDLKITKVIFIIFINIRNINSI